jgi:PIN domain nuclease of toxin-antitoxin system
VKVLVDTHLLLWAVGMSPRLSPEARAIIEDRENAPTFSVVSLWEMAIKAAKGLADFDVDPRLVRGGLLDAGWTELPIASEHAFAAGPLPPIHRDPFDRMLVAQAIVEGMVLLTRDARLERYPGPVRLV